MANPILGPQQILNIYKNPNKVWQDYLARGIIDKKWKTKEMFQTAVQKAMNSAALYKKLKAKDPKIKSVDLKHAIAHVTGKPYEEYKGIPLRYKRDAKEGVLTSGKGRVVAVALDERRYSERIPEKVKDWFIEGEASGRLSKGSLKRYEKHITSGNTENAKLRRRLHELTGISWHKGHLRALAQLGSNDPLAQVSELGAENLSHNKEDAIRFKDIEELGLPTDWWSSATEFVLAEKGETGRGGVRLTDLTPGDKASVARHQADPNMVTAARRQKIENAALKRALIQANKAKKENRLNTFSFEVSSYIDKDGNFNPNRRTDSHRYMSGSINAAEQDSKQYMYDKGKGGRIFKQSVDLLTEAAVDATVKKYGGPLVQATWIGGKAGYQVTQGNVLGAGLTLGGARIETIEKLNQDIYLPVTWRQGLWKTR